MFGLCHCFIPKRGAPRVRNEPEDLLLVTDFTTYGKGVTD
jgi:hypothetical protein